MRNKNLGFTLIELLAVIIILGVLMIIAIPSVTEYIQSSRKNAYITMATQYIGGARNKINSSEIPMYDTEATYYLPASCISLEKGGNSPFGELVDAYIVVTYDGFGYDYYWTSRDSSNMGILLTDEKLLDESRVQAGITSISTEVGIGDREKILIINNCDGNDLTEQESIDTIPIDGKLDESVKASETLYSVIIKEGVLDSSSSTYVTSSTGINFQEAPSNTNGKGVYIRSGTENDKYPIYYYRGAVTNNNVIFAGFCWKIVRTTETGGIKIIYNGVPIDGKCNNTGVNSQIGVSAFNENYNDNAYVGYMYGAVGASTYEETHKSTKESTSSTIKTYIDEWYKNNIGEKGYTSKLEDTVWCNDRSFASNNTGTGAGVSLTNYGAYSRLGVWYSDLVNPNLKCINKNDRFTVSSVEGNTALIYPVALLTVDEFILAGHSRYGYSSSNYLYTGQMVWTLSPAYYYGTQSNVYGLYNSENINNYEVNNSYGVRPSVSLKSNTKISSGSGLANDPYIIK